ncbi:L-arabinose 1-dehydrogenase (NAD(P)(+)) [uncultured archaeon]|nr:L-arabinose 1-dehydrogenase (NAD(P)(+)) [uncultured archaeon]
MRCFVTGATGRLGSVLVKALLDRHHFVTALVTDENERMKLPKGAEAIVGDITDRAAVEKGVGECQVVFHLAALVSYTASWEQLERVNIKGTRTVADACSKHKTRLIYVSTTGVYGKRLAEMPANEKTPTNPTDLYGKSKLEAERIVGSYFGTFPYMIFRPAVIYGPPFFDVYARVLKKIENGSMQVLGDGKNVIPFVHSDDVVEALMLGARSELPAGTFVLAGNSTMTQEAIYRFAAEALGVEFKPGHTSPGVAKALISLTSLVKKSGISDEDVNVLSSHRIFDTNRAEKILGWKPGTNLMEGIRQMVEMYNERKSRIAKIQEMRKLKEQGQKPQRPVASGKPGESDDHMGEINGNVKQD